ncbi:MAG: hypothetical protein FDZ69_09110 [Deltaproteobacteria bacterium]|nr:MAG: hypothetical protein FDZ69_09110 [Deltaproteobacteria bacterium]
MSSPSSRFGPAALTTAGILLAATVFALALQPLWSNDLWWHLATGRYLLETRGFLDTDPFSIAGNSISPGRTTILNGYWLAQVIMAGCYNLAGERGVILLRAALLTAVPVLLLAYGRRRGLSAWPLLLAAALTGWTLLYFTAERPNLFTILFVPALVCLLDRIGPAPRQKPFPGYALGWTAAVGVLLLAWANMHGGFILGAAVVGCYLLGETAKVFLLRLPVPRRALALLWGSLGAALLATLATPAGIAPYLDFIGFQGGVLQEKTAEFLNPFAAAASGVAVYPYFLAGLLFAALLLRRRRQVDLTEAAIGLFLLAVSLTAFRYLPLFVGGVGLFVARELTRLEDEIPAVRKALPAAVLLTLLAAGVCEGPAAAGKFREYGLLRGRTEAGLFPQQAADFLEREQLTGVRFGHFNWGGYLAWRQRDGSRVFIDGRVLNLPLFHAYTRILWIPEEMRGLLDRYGVTTIVMPRLNPSTGELYALTEFLALAPEWLLAYRDETAMVMVRRGSFPQLPDHRTLPKRLIYQDVLADAGRRLQAGERPDHLLKAREAALRHLSAPP